MTIQQDQCARTRDAQPYVLGRLLGRRLDNYARHLRHCAQCAEEVDLLQGAADAVPLLASRQRTTQALGSHHQESHHQGPSHQGPSHQGPDHQGPDHQESHHQGSVGSARPEGDARTPGAHAPPRRLLKNPVPKPAQWAFVALAILAVVTVVLSHRAADVRYVHIRAGWSGGGAALQLQGNQLELLVTGMPTPASGEGYQVWVVDRLGKRLVPTGAWLHLNRAGQAGAKVPGDYHDWDGLAVYVEPLHGRRTTRSGAVVVADLRKQP